MNTCVKCGGRFSWGDTLIQRFRVNIEGEIEPSGYAHSYHFSNEERID